MAGMAELGEVGALRCWRHVEISGADRNVRSPFIHARWRQIWGASGGMASLHGREPPHPSGFKFYVLGSRGS